MKKIGLICLTLVLVLGALGVGYALWSEELVIDTTVETGEVDWEFWNDIDPTLPPYLSCQDVGDDPGTVPPKDVGSTTGEFFDTDSDGDYDLLVITVSNAYPLYWNHCSTWVHVNGSIPIIIAGATMTYNGDDYALPDGVWVTTNDGVLKFKWGNNTGSQLHFCDERNMSFTFQVLQPAQPGSIYTFTITIEAVQYNEYSP
jgi:hypothetical protein